MTVQTTIAAADVDLTRIMRDSGIKRIQYYTGGIFLVELEDTRCGSAPTVGQAFEEAKRADAVRLS